MYNEASGLYRQSPEPRLESLLIRRVKQEKAEFRFVNEHFESKRNELKGNYELRVTNYGGNQLKIEN
jgi:hypothetical protein